MSLITVTGSILSHDIFELQQLVQLYRDIGENHIGCIGLDVKCNTYRGEGYITFFTLSQTGKVVEELCIQWN